MNNNKNLLIGIVVAVIVVIGGVAIYSSMQKGDSDTMAPMPSDTSMAMETTSKGVLVGGAYMTPDKNLVQNAANANNVTTLVAAVKAAGLDVALAGKGPFTVFAPSDAAFAKLPAGTLAMLLKPENKAKLVDILGYHVVYGSYKAADLYDGQILGTLDAKNIVIHKSKSGEININNVAVVQTPDIISSNGVTFIIDTVLTPVTK